MPTHELSNAELYILDNNQCGIPIGELKEVTITTTTPESGDDYDGLTMFDLGAEYEASLDHLHGKRLSRKKFKKFLMSEGKHRNTAEACCTILQLKRIPYRDAKVQYILMGWPWFLSWLMSYS